MNADFLYYILKAPYDNVSQQPSPIPVISKIKRDRIPIHFELLNDFEGEGPFNSIFELKRKSKILAGITKMKHRQRILKTKNINEIKDIILTESGTSVDKDFIHALAHTTIGKISKKEVKGLHFMNPDKVKIINITEIDKQTKVYSARIQILNENTGKWIEKEEETTFFPDEWSIHRLFHECLYAYKNKIKVSERIYNSRTISNIPVKFIIDDTGKILTFYPLINNHQIS